MWNNPQTGRRTGSNNEEFIMEVIVVSIALFMGIITFGVVGSHQPDKVNANKCEALQNGADISTTHCDDSK